MVSGEIFADFAVRKERESLTGNAPFGILTLLESLDLDMM